MQNDISKEFSLGGLLRFTFPTIIMMMFVATYIIADGIFVSRFVGTAALSAINIVYRQRVRCRQRRFSKTAFYTIDTLCHCHGSDSFPALLCIH